MNLKDQLKESTDKLEIEGINKSDWALVLGSGLSNITKEFSVKKSIGFDQIPHFCPPSVEGHPGKLLAAEVADIPVILMQGRVHFYEGHSWDEVVYPIRTLWSFGVKNILLTNAAGGIQKDMQPGDFMLISDHINLFGSNPLRGPNHSFLGERFPDCSQIYHPQWGEGLKTSLQNAKAKVHKGVYCGVSGPSYETPAEIRYLGAIGANAVGMSTVPEAIVARHCGMNVLGLSCITNKAAGLSSTPLNHAEVKEVANRVESQLATGLKNFFSTLNKSPE